jgi:hypothetical protein
MATELLLYDLKRGRDGFTRQPLESKLVGMPDMVYQGIRVFVPEIAKAVASPEFAEAVKQGYEEIQLIAKGSDKLK